MNCYEYYHEKKNKNNLFYHELSSMMISYDYVEKVRFLEKNGFSSSFTFKNNTFQKKSLFLVNLYIVIYLKTYISLILKVFYEYITISKFSKNRFFRKIYF
jgi:hypothetical protein